MAVTRSDLEELVTVVNNQLRSVGRATTIKLDYSYGQPRVGVADSRGCIYRWLSNRMRTGLVYDWLVAFSKGIDEGQPLRGQYRRPE